MKNFAIFLATAVCFGMGMVSCNHDDTFVDDAKNNGTWEGDTLWFDLMHISTLSSTQFIDSLCKVEPSAASSRNILNLMVPKGTNITIIDYLYKSTDGKGNKANLSAQLLVPIRDGKISNESLVIENHATQIADADVPTNKINIGALTSLLGAPVVTCDLLGYGSTVDLPLNYICYHAAARNTVDAAKVAQYILHSKWLNLKLTAPILPVYNQGYSQGGYDALAVHKYLETEASSEEKRLLPLVKTRCGAGPYDLRAFLEAVLKWDDYAYSPYIVACFISFNNYHAKDFPTGFQLSDILSEKLRNSDLIEMISSKRYGDEAIKKYVVDLLDGDISMSNIFSKELLNPEGDLHDACMQLAEGESLITGWKPQKPIHFFHATNDDCIPVQCMYLARKAFADCPNVTFDEYAAEAVPGLHSMSYIQFMMNLISKGW